MAIGKEHVYALEQLSKRQSQIWNDSADIGLEATPDITKMIKRELAALASLEGLRIDNGFSHRSTWTTCITRLGYEMDGGKVFGTEVRVTKLTEIRTKKSWYQFIFIPSCWMPGKIDGNVAA